MADPKHTPRPSLKNHHPLLPPAHDKENLSRENHRQAGGEKEGRRKIEILRDSALLALVEKNDIIEGLMQSTQVDRSEEEQQLLQEVQRLRERIREMEDENRELQEMVGLWKGRLNDERQLWNEEYARLQEEREALQNYIEEQQNDTHSLAQQLNQALQQNAQLITELNDAQISYRYLKEAMIQPPPPSLSSLPSHPCLPSQPPSPQSVVQLLDSPQQQRQTSEYLIEQLSYTQQQWQDGLSIDKQMEQIQHCLKGSLRAINLIDNYSVHPHPQVSDSESQFTARYFKYPQDPLTDRPCQHIPEQDEEELPSSPTHTSLPWLQRSCWLAGGLSLGVLVGWVRFGR